MANIIHVIQTNPYIHVVKRFIAWTNHYTAGKIYDIAPHFSCSCYICYLIVKII